MANFNRLEGLEIKRIENYELEEQDTRFMKCVIKVLHLGQNFNGSYFSKEVVENAMDSIKNTPILAFLEENSKGELDVSDHRVTWSKDDDGNWISNYKGQAIGVIPENCNPRFEKHQSDSGEKEYLVVDGLIWTKWNEVNDIFEKENIKWQSMELDENSYSGHFDKNNIFHFDTFKFNGCCCLSVVDNILPAMENADIVVNFSMNEVENKLNMFKKYFCKEENKLGREEVITKFSYLKGEDVDALISNEDLSPEELEKALFAISNSRKIEAIDEALSTMKCIKKYYDGEMYETKKYYFMDIIEDDNIVLVEDNEDYKFYGIPFVMEGDKAVLDFEKATRYIQGDWRPYQEGESEPEVIDMFSEFKQVMEDKHNEIVESVKTSFKAEETQEYKDLLEKFSQLETANKELTEENVRLSKFEKETLDAERKRQEEELLEKFSEIKDVEGFEEIKSKLPEMSIEEAENKMFALLGKVNFSKKHNSKPKDNSVKIPYFSGSNNDDNLSEAEKRYGKDILKYKNM